MIPSLLGNLKPNAKEIQIIVHTNPDFDCFASAYLAKYYIQHKEFPENYEEIVKYAELIDSGKLKLNPNELLTPYSFTHVLSISIERNKFNSIYDFQVAYLERGLELIEYIFKRLSELTETERSIYNPTFFNNNHPFKREERLVLEDYQKYQYDLQTICEKRSMRLPTLNGSSRKVDGLFWNDIPTCSMDRLWARGDIDSPSGSGYVFTFIPKEIKHTPGIIINEFESESIQDAIRTTSQVIISVDGNSDVTLVDLGKQLEIEERKMEYIIFGETLKEKWRSRDPKKRRFTDAWFDSCDPWYDGRNYQYQIVDAPQIGSLLRLEQIKDIAINYTKPRVKGNKTKILYPFEFKTANFSKLHNSLRKNNYFQAENLLIDKDLVMYFRPYVREYLFNSKRNNLGYSQSFSFSKSENLSLNYKMENKKVTSNIKECGKENKDEVFLEVGNTNIHLFRYGIGFIVIEIEMLSHFKHEDLLLELLMDINRELCEGKSAQEIRTYYQYFLGENVTKWIDEYEEGIMYSDVTLSVASYLDAAKEELLYSLFSQTEWNSSDRTEKSPTTTNINRMYYDINEHTIMGFSKKGASL